MSTLSSGMTFFYKYILIIIWGVFLGFYMLPMLNYFSQADGYEYAFIIFGIIVTLILIFIMGIIKKVEFDGENFYVSNFIKSDKIHISKVNAVSGTVLLSPELVWLKLEEGSIFGTTIIFIPTYRFLSGFDKHPIVDELNRKLSDVSNSKMQGA